MKEVVDKINKIKSILVGFENADETRKRLVDEIEKAIERELPYEIRSFYVNSSPSLLEMAAQLFMGYEPIDLESIVRMYRDIRDKSACYFLGAFSEIDSNLVLPEDEGFEIIQDLEGEIEEGPIVTHMKTVIPLMEASGYYIVQLYKPNGDTEIAIATEDYCLSSIAPSLEEYLDNLKVGVEKGAFKSRYNESCDELEIDAPEIWSKKLKVIG